MMKKMIFNFRRNLRVGHLIGGFDSRYAVAGIINFKPFF